MFLPVGRILLEEDSPRSCLVVIPISLIPSDEKKEIDKRKLAFAVIVALMMFTPLLIGLFSGLKSLLKPPLTPRQVFVSGLLSAYKCQVARGALSPNEGKALLENIFKENSMDVALMYDPDLNRIAASLSSKLDGQCSSVGMDEEAFLNAAYLRL